MEILTFVGAHLREKALVLIMCRVNELMNMELAISVRISVRSTVKPIHSNLIVILVSHIVSFESK